ncbi:MAG: SRPBCC domain-containing protein [Planctomycetota bacterium]
MPGKTVAGFDPAGSLGLVQAAACALLLTVGCTSPLPASERSEAQEILRHHVYIEADYDDVWRRLTTREGFEDWYTVACASFSTAPGAELVWAEGERVIYEGRMLRARHGEGIAWEFRFVGFGFDEPMTTAAFEVLGRGPTVLVSVRHDVTAAPETAAMISEVGWAKPLSRLKTLLETGRPMPWPEEPER